MYSMYFRISQNTQGGVGWGEEKWEIEVRGGGEGNNEQNKNQNGYPTLREGDCLESRMKALQL